jgi:glycosyltransferase involved in cell wall biosynthesis
MQVLVQSYQRLKYLKQTVESLRHDDVEICIVDGGSDAETVEYIGKVANKCLLYTDNPGADYLKNEGIKQLITDDHFILSADDIVYPKGYADMMRHRFNLLNKVQLQWVFCSCNMANVEAQPIQWKSVNGVELHEVSGPQSASAVVSKVALMQVGLFPVQFGKYGAGDWALGKALLRNKYKCCYLREPMVEHLGNNNAVDYPEFQIKGDLDINENYYKAIK